MAETVTPLLGTPYLLGESLGGGAHGEVFRGRHESLDKVVIIKVMRVTAAEAPQVADRMRLEAQTLARFKHANLVEVIDSGISQDDKPFFVMQDDRGHSLAAELRQRRRLPAAEAVALCCDLLAGLAYIHEQGLVHRDLQPANVLLCKDKQSGKRIARILDFGLVKLLASAEKHGLQPLAVATAENTTVGTPHYMSAEQAKGLNLDARSDLYAVSSVLYTMLCGEPPFANAEGLAGILRAVISESPRPPSERTGQVGQNLDAAILKGLHKDREARFATAPAMAAALREALKRDVEAKEKWASTQVLDIDSQQTGEAKTKKVRPAAEERVFRAGQTCGGYAIGRLLGKGGMGEVYHATKDGEEFAIKVLSSRASLRSDITDRFKREVQLLSYLDNVHVVRFYEAGVLESRGGTVLWVALEYVDGTSLREVVAEKGGTLSADEIVRWGRQIAIGIHEAHKIKVTHRDLKPENVLLTKGNVCKVIDFGIAKFRNWGQKSTSNIRMGTLAYMAPEQIDPERAEEISECTDVYALGLILYELATGKQPFIAGGYNPQAIVLQKLTQQLPNVCAMRPEFPVDVAAIIARAVSLETAARHPSAEALADALASVQRQRADERRAAMLGESDSSLQAPTAKLAPAGRQGSALSESAITLGSQDFSVQARVAAPPSPHQAPMHGGQPAAWTPSPQSAQPMSAQPMSAQPISGHHPAAGQVGPYGSGPYAVGPPSQGMAQPGPSGTFGLVQSGAQPTAVGRGKWLAVAAGLVVAVGILAAALVVTSGSKAAGEKPSEPVSSPSKSKQREAKGDQEAAAEPSATADPSAQPARGQASGQTPPKAAVASPKPKKTPVIPVGKRPSVVPKPALPRPRRKPIGGETPGF